MIRKSLTILSLIGLLLSVGIARTSGSGALGYIDASGNNLYVLNESIRLGRIVWEEMPASARGFYFTRSPWGTTGDIQVSLWAPIYFFATCCLYFLLSLGPYRRRKRKKLGLCLKCGYDLRGSKERCPECGSGFSN